MEHAKSKTLTDEQVEDQPEDGSSNFEQTELSDYRLTRDRVRREIKPPARLSEADIVSLALVVALDVDCYEPKTYLEAITCKESARWTISLEQELLFLLKNKTWIIVNKPFFTIASGVQMDLQEKA